MKPDAAMKKFSTQKVDEDGHLLNFRRYTVGFNVKWS